MYAITRRKAALNAWYWVVHFRRRGKLYSKRFYDVKQGSSKKAIAAPRQSVVTRLADVGYASTNPQEGPAAAQPIARKCCGRWETASMVRR